MKRIYCAFVLVIIGTLVTAQSVDLGQFPKGKWIDNNWNAVWEFGANSIKLYDIAGNLLFDFDKKVENLKVNVTLTKAQVSFYCKETERSYTFSKDLKDLNLDMEIKRDWTTEGYNVDLQFQK